MSYENGVNARFMTRMHVVIGDVDISCDVIDMFSATNDDMAPFNAKLAAHGAKATLLATRLVIDVCDERIIITALKVTPRQIAELHLVATSVIYNVEFEVAGCHEHFDGVIGQLYKCEYNKNKFVYDEQAVERKFHLSADRVLSLDVGVSKAPTKCLGLREDGAIVGSALLKF